MCARWESLIYRRNVQVQFIPGGARGLRIMLKVFVDALRKVTHILLNSRRRLARCQVRDGELRFCSQRIELALLSILLVRERSFGPNSSDASCGCRKISRRKVPLLVVNSPQRLRKYCSTIRKRGKQCDLTTTGCVTFVRLVCGRSRRFPVRRPNEM
jgi:hypothetical protein